MSCTGTSNLETSCVVGRTLPRRSVILGWQRWPNLLKLLHSEQYLIQTLTVIDCLLGCERFRLLENSGSWDFGLHGARSMPTYRGRKCGRKETSLQQDCRYLQRLPCHARINWRSRRIQVLPMLGSPIDDDHSMSGEISSRSSTTTETTNLAWNPSRCHKKGRGRWPTETTFIERIFWSHSRNTYSNLDYACHWINLDLI